MEIQEERQGAVMVVRPVGPLVGDDAAALKAQVLGLLGKVHGRVVLDAAGISHLDSRGLEALVDISNEMSASGRAMKLCGANETVRQVLQLTGLSSMFEHFADAVTAVRSFL